MTAARWCHLLLFLDRSCGWITRSDTRFACAQNKLSFQLQLRAQRKTRRERGGRNLRGKKWELIKVKIVYDVYGLERACGKRAREWRLAFRPKRIARSTEHKLNHNILTLKYPRLAMWSNTATAVTLTSESNCLLVSVTVGNEFVLSFRIFAPSLYFFPSLSLLLCLNTPPPSLSLSLSPFLVPIVSRVKLHIGPRRTEL